MCCLFGITDPNGVLGARRMNYALNVLAAACEVRGTDASGIAYNHNGRLTVYKRPVPGHSLHIRVPEGVKTVMGHTRMTTQGCEKFNYNNHPFYGKAGVPFALAHNGIIYNDIYLRETESLPATNISTDSYIAVQLIEKMDRIGFDSLRYMAERLDGSFTITVMDNTDNLYIVKGDNPICLYYYPKAGVYIYASTEEILQSALKYIKLGIGRPEKVTVKCGEIVRIDAKGERTKEQFNTERLYQGCGYYPYRLGWDTGFCYRSQDPSGYYDAYEPDYIDELKAAAHFLGYSTDYIDLLFSEGYDPDEIEEMLYCGA